MDFCLLESKLTVKTVIFTLDKRLFLNEGFDDCIVLLLELYLFLLKLTHTHVALVNWLLQQGVCLLKPSELSPYFLDFMGEIVHLSWVDASVDSELAIRKSSNLSA